MTDAPDAIVHEIAAALTTAEKLLGDGLEAGAFDGGIYAAVVAALERARLALIGHLELKEEKE